MTNDVLLNHQSTTKEKQLVNFDCCILEHAVFENGHSVYTHDGLYRMTRLVAYI